MAAETLTRLDRMESFISAMASPRLNKKEAMKFMGYGRERFDLLMKMNKIPHHTDAFGKVFFLKDELLETLRRN